MVGGVSVEPRLLETRQAVLVVGDIDDLGLHGRSAQRGRQGFFGGRIGYQAHALAGQILHPSDARGHRRQEARAVDEDHVTEGNLLHAAERDRGRSALQVDCALHELAHPVGGRRRHPVDLEFGELQRLLDGGGYLQAEVHRVAGRLTVGVEEGERPGRFTVAATGRATTRYRDEILPGSSVRRQNR